MEEKNTLAITSLVLGILSICCCGFPVGIAAIICALVDRSRRCGFEGLALAGFILGIIACITGLASYVFSLVVYGTLFPDFEQILAEMEMQMLSLFRFF
jgi:thiamine transporter ThiT